MDSLKDYFQERHSGVAGMAAKLCEPIRTCPELKERIRDIGFLPLLDSGIRGFSAEAMMDEDCRYTVFPDGSWEWKLWEWKGSAIREGFCVYGKFFNGKAGFISREWWRDFCNWRRSRHSPPEPNSIEDVILQTLRTEGSMVARQLRAACGFTGPKMRSRFDAYVARLQMACRIVTEDFVYPVDKYGREYGFGWSLLTTPESFLGISECRSNCPPEESFQRMKKHMGRVLPQATDKQIEKMLR